MRNRNFILTAALLSIGGLSMAASQAQTASHAGSTSASAHSTTPSDDVADAQQQVSGAVQVVNRMKRDTELLGMLKRARGVFIVPKYGKGAAIVGGQGGEGVLLVRHNGEWTSPAFYNIGGVSVGAQLGGAGGSIAMLLMTDKALEKVTSSDSSFSLDERAGLTVIKYDRTAQTSQGKGDVVLWSDTKGLFAGASVGVTNINRDEDENRAYYSASTTPQQIFSGIAKNANATTLRDALPSQVASAK